MTTANVETVDVTAIGRDIEQLAVERYRVTLRECVHSLPTNSDDGLWVQTQVLRFLNATTVSELKEAVPAAFRVTTVREPEEVRSPNGSASSDSPTAAPSFNSSEQSDLEPVA